MSFRLIVSSLRIFCVSSSSVFYTNPPRPDLLWGPLSLLSYCLTRSVSPWVNHPGREAIHPLPRILIAWYSVKQRTLLHGVDNFALLSASH